MNVIDMYLRELSQTEASATMISHSLAAKKALMLKDLEKTGKLYKSSGGFKKVAPKLRKPKKRGLLQQAKDVLKGKRAKPAKK